MVEPFTLTRKMLGALKQELLWFIFLAVLAQ